MSTRNQIRGENTRREILQAANDLFTRQGFHGTSMRQIAQQAGIALGGVYNHFASKEEVFREVFFEYHPYHEVLPVLLDSQQLGVEQFVRDAFNRILLALQNRPNFMNLLFIEIVEFKGMHSHELFEQLMPDEMMIVKGLVETNRDRLRSIPPWMLLRAFFGLLFSYYLTELLLAEQAPEEFSHGAVDHMIDIFLHGVLKDNKRS